MTLIAERLAAHAGARRSQGRRTRCGPERCTCSTLERRRRDVRRLIGLVSVIAVLVPAALGSAVSPAAPLLGVEWVSGDAQLMRLDPSSLLPVGPRLSVGTHLQGWSTSADGRTLVLADERGELLFVDTGTLRRAGTHTLPDGPNVVATAWLGSRLVAIDENLDAVDVTVIGARQRVVHARTFTSSFLASRSTPRSV